MSTEIITVRDKKKNLYQVFTDIKSALNYCEITGRNKIIINHCYKKTGQAFTIEIWQYEKTGETMQHYLDTQSRYNKKI